jgi:hypothetical protein
MCVADLQELFERFWLLRAVNVVAVLPCRDSLRVFTFFPQREHCHLAGTPVQVDQWPRVRFGFVKLSVLMQLCINSDTVFVCLGGLQAWGHCGKVQ